MGETHAWQPLAKGGTGEKMWLSTTIFLQRRERIVEFEEYVGVPRFKWGIFALVYQYVALDKIPYITILYHVIVHTLPYFMSTWCQR